MNNQYYLRTWDTGENWKASEINREEYMAYRPSQTNGMQRMIVAGKTATVNLCCFEGNLTRQIGFVIAVWFMSGKYTKVDVDLNRCSYVESIGISHLKPTPNH